MNATIAPSHTTSSSEGQITTPAPPIASPESAIETTGRYAPRQLLVVSADFDVISWARLSLDPKEVEVTMAYSSRDAFYSLKHTEFDVLLVDGRMQALPTEASVAERMAMLSERPPMVVVRSENPANLIRREHVISLPTLDAEQVNEALHALLEGRAFSRAMPETDRLDDTQHRMESLWRSSEIKTLFALSRSLTEVLDLSEVLNRVVEAARSLTRADEGMILLHDGEQGDLYLRAKVGIENEVARNFRVKTMDTLAGQVYETGTPLLVGASGLLKVRTEYFVNSLLYVPILLKGQCIGVLGVNNKTKHDVFAERDQELLLNLASYAAIAIENARVHGQSVKRALELRSLVETSEAVNASLSLDYTLRAASEQLQRIVGNLNVAELYLWEQDGRRALPSTNASISAAPAYLYRVSRRAAASWRGQRPTLPIEPGDVVARALAHGGIYFTNDANILASLDLIHRGAKSVCVLPIIIEGQPIGVAVGYYTQHISEETLAPEALERAMRLTHEVIGVLAEGRQSTAQLLPAAEQIRAWLGADWCQIGLVSPSAHGVQLSLLVGAATWTTPPYAALPTRHFPLLDVFIGQSPLPVQITEANAGDWSGGPLLLRVLCARAVLLLPLVYNGQPRGVAILMNTERAEPFSEDSVDLARNIINQVTVALENANLHRDLGDSLRELKETQGRLIQAARLSAMGEMAAAVAHQINNPLTTIVLDTQLMLDDVRAGSLHNDVEDTLQAILRAGKRAANVANRLLLAVRPNANMEQPPEPVDVLNTLAETVALVRAHIERGKITLLEEYAHDIQVRVLARAGELDDVWLNLLLNAHDALNGRENARMGINMVVHDAQSEAIGHLWNAPAAKQAAESPASTLEVRIWDNGPGIPPSLVEEIFKPFFTTKPVGEGTGLGLHICRQMVERMGGRIEVESQVNTGTVFHVWLPIFEGA